MKKCPDDDGATIDKKIKVILTVQYPYDCTLPLSGTRTHRTSPLARTSTVPNTVHAGVGTEVRVCAVYFVFSTFLLFQIL